MNLYERKKILEEISDKRFCYSMTICGSCNSINRQRMYDYETYYTLKGNCIFMPTNIIKTENNKELIQLAIDELYSKENCIFSHMHKRKIMDSEVVLIISDGNGLGADTASELEYALLHNKIILFNTVADEHKDKFLFNNDNNFPLYLRKEGM